MMKNKALYISALGAVIGISIIVSSVHPLSNGDWWLEILPVFIAIPIIYFLGKIYKLSLFSYTLLAIYLLMPIAQAHYGVANVPLGWRISEVLGSARNMFDRLEHFSFGLLCVYPMFEICKKEFTAKRIYLTYFVPFALVMTISAVYEVIEWIVHIFATERLAFLFVAAQADLWDATEDMAVAMWGALIALGIIFTVSQFEKRRQRKTKGAN